MCQAEDWWCIGCKNVRPGISRCEMYDPDSDFCENTNLENPPFKPVFEDCENLKCKYVDPALVWHPDQPLSPASQAFAVRLKEATDKMDIPPAAALDAKSTESKTGSPQSEDRIDMVEASRCLETKISEHNFNSDTGHVGAVSVRSLQIPKTSSVEPPSRTYIPREHQPAMSAIQVDNDSIAGSKGVSNEQLGTQLRPITSQPSNVQHALGSHLAMPIQPQPAALGAVSPKDLFKTVSPRSLPNTLKGANTTSRFEPVGMFEASKDSHHRLLNRPTSNDGSILNGITRANPSSIAQLGSVAPDLTQQQRSISHAGSMHGGWRAAAAAMTSASIQSRGTLPAVHSQVPTPFGGLRSAMRPAHQAVMDKLMNPNAAASSRSSHSPSIPHWQMTLQNNQSQQYTNTPQPASAIRQPQDGSINMNSTPPRKLLHRSSLGDQVHQLRAQYYVPTYHPSPVDFGAISSGTMMENYLDNALNINPEQSYVTNWAQSGGLFPNHGYVNQQQHIGNWNEMGTHYSFVQQVPPDLSNSHSNLWAQPGSQFPSFGGGLPQYQAAMPSFSTQTVPGSGFSGHKRSQPMASDDRLFWEHQSSAPLQSPMYQQNGYSPMAYRPGLYGHHMMGNEHPAKRMRIHQEGAVGKRQFDQNNSSSSTNVRKND